MIARLNQYVIFMMMVKRSNFVPYTWAMLGFKVQFIRGITPYFPKIFKKY